MIHPTAIVHPDAQVDSTASIGPYSVIDKGVEFGPRCVVGPHCHFLGRTRIGAGNQFHAGCIIGDAPQDLKYKDALTGLVIGEDNVFREHVTVHRSNQLEEETTVGSHNYLMANSHVGHNCVLWNHIILANGTLLGGHVTVQDRAFISGNCLLHQFVHVGTLALMQGGAAISKDLPPFTIARGYNGICGLNVIGLRRAGLPPEQRLELKRLYHLLFRSGLLLKTALAKAGQPVPDTPAAQLLQFVAASTRGVCSDNGGADGAAE